ncbi:unnamed protein product [Caenorhabditis sp. 36 PRJEB53466]|nr:unnamed protein product [Caenorhabditis sp. 36 PRJEB53466]
MSYCNSTNFLATADFYTNFLHYFGFFTIPMHLFGAYCILFVTPANMRLLTTPFILIPAFAGYPLGVFKTIGIDPGAQAYFAAAVIAIVAVAMFGVFESRLLVLFYFEHWWRRARIPYLIFNYLLALTFFLPTYLRIPDQEKTRRLFLTVVPCVPVYVDASAVFFLADHIKTLLFSCVFAGLLFIEQILVSAFYTKHVLNKRYGTNLSVRTVELQKKFQTALNLQMLIPIIIMLFPLLYLGGATCFIYHNQVFNNFCLIVLSSHGFFSTIVMIIIHSPYREFTFSLLRIDVWVRPESLQFAQDVQTDAVS